MHILDSDVLLTILWALSPRPKPSTTIPELVVSFSRSLRVPTTSELWRRRREREADSAATSTSTAVERDPFLCSGTAASAATTAAASGSQSGRAGSQEEQVWRVGQDGRDGASCSLSLSPSLSLSSYLFHTFRSCVMRYSLAPGWPKYCQTNGGQAAGGGRPLIDSGLRPGPRGQSTPLWEHAHEGADSIKIRFDTVYTTGFRGRSRFRSRIRHRRESSSVPRGRAFVRGTGPADHSACAWAERRHQCYFLDK
jgi:hypothetical protein